MLGHFFRSAKSAEQQSAGIGAFAANEPVVVSLIGISAVFGHAAAVIELLQISDGLLDGGPYCLSEGNFVFAAGENEIAINHQNKFGIQIFPAVGVLPIEMIYQDKWIFVGDAEIVRDCAFIFADPKVEIVRLLCFPDPNIF